MAKSTRPAKTRSPKKAAPRAAGKTATAAKKSLPMRSRSASIDPLINRYKALTIRNNTGVAIRVTLTTPANQSYTVSPNLANNGSVTATTDALTTWLGNACDDIVVSYQALNNATAIVDATNRFCFNKNESQGATYTFRSPAPGPILRSSP